MPSGDWEPVKDEVPCRFCKAVGTIELSVWESSDGGHEDYHYRCTECEKDWWIDGIDA
jgi:hypothetical protein